MITPANGTPSTLDEAIKLAMCFVGTNAEQMRYAVIKDFLSQRFGAAMLEASSEHEGNTLNKLFLSITRREK